MADGEIRTQRKVLHGGFIKFYETSFYHPYLVGHIGEVVGVRSPERGAEAFGKTILVQVGPQQLFASPFQDPIAKGKVEREWRRMMTDGGKKQAELVTTTDPWLAQVLDEIPQVDLSKLLPNFPGYRCPPAACLIYVQETGVGYSKYIPIVALFRANSLSESLRSAAQLLSIKWTLEGLPPRFLGEQDRYQIVPAGSCGTVAAHPSAEKEMKCHECNAHGPQGLHSLLGKESLEVKA